MANCPGNIIWLRLMAMVNTPADRTLGARRVEVRARQGRAGLLIRRI